MNTSTSTPILGSNTLVDSTRESSSNMNFFTMGPSPQDHSCPHPSMHSINDQKSHFSYVSEASMTRKLVRTDSTYEEDSFDESITDLSHMNHRHILRQQWFRKNNLVSRLRRSISTASNSSSSSSGISSNVYSNYNANNNNNNSSSFASSFSSSFSATMSSMSESCDSDPHASCSSPSNNEINDYPKIIRKSSFKNKFMHCYRPYNKTRRLSLQLKNIELSKNSKLWLTRSSFRPSMKYSMSCYSLGTRQDRKYLYAMATLLTKSNPSSPDKILGYVRSGRQNDQLPAQHPQLILNQESNSPSNFTGSNLVRSKSLDDLNTLFYCPNQNLSGCLMSSVGTEHFNALSTNNPTISNPYVPGAANIDSQLGQLSNPPISLIHYSSFNRICDLSSKPQGIDNSQSSHNMSEQMRGPQAQIQQSSSSTSSPLGFFSQPNSLQQSIDQQRTLSFLISSLNRVGVERRCDGGPSISSEGIDADPINVDDNVCNNNNNNNEMNDLNDNNNTQNLGLKDSSLIPTTDNDSSCDIDSVMKKINSLHM
ncbi:Endoplasmic reticulum-Golgi intermediate compartment protein 3 [Sarcoptes scabiei]|nr:Endoplasmic reticulum-Golgi intermediate compartment protein 3 [Sarcoptes scabiei]